MCSDSRRLLARLDKSDGLCWLASHREVVVQRQGTVVIIVVRAAELLFRRLALHVPPGPDLGVCVRHGSVQT